MDNIIIFTLYFKIILYAFVNAFVNTFKLTHS